MWKLEVRSFAKCIRYDIVYHMVYLHYCDCIWCVRALLSLEGILAEHETIQVLSHWEPYGKRVRRVTSTCRASKRPNLNRVGCTDWEIMVLILRNPSCSETFFEQTVSAVQIWKYMSCGFSSGTLKFPEDRVCWAPKSWMSPMIAYGD